MALLAIYHHDKREEQVNELNKNFCLEALIYQKKRRKKCNKKYEMMVIMNSRMIAKNELK